MENSNIILFPDFQKLKDEVDRLKTELSMLLLERDELQFVICRNIETAYMLQLGGLEYKAYEAQSTALRLKRKIELIQAKKNRQEKIILSEIEDVLDNEFAEYQQKLNEQINKMNDALEHSKGKVLSEEENKELKKLYRKIVKTLHPDINPDVTGAEIRLFNNAITAYKNGDLATLRIIDAMVDNHRLPEKEHDVMTELIEEKKRFVSLIEKINKSIGKIKSEYPYTMKDIVEDPDKISKEKATLEAVLKQYNDLIKIYKEKLDEMLR